MSPGIAFGLVIGYRYGPNYEFNVTPDQFIAKWQAADLKERSAAQSHFIDLCKMLDEPAPTDADPSGEWYAFERGATKTTGGEGWADVWKRGHFGWEYKGKRKDLNAAFAQLQQYALALENPPLLVVCDLDRFEIHTNWTNSVSEVHRFTLADLRDTSNRQKLKWTFSDPERLKPGKTRQSLTEEAAAEFARLAQRLRERNFPADVVAHFINQLVFCMFAEDVDLLPNKMFKRMLEHAVARPDEFQQLAADLFNAMKTGGRIGFEQVAWFNGGLFQDETSLPLNKEDILLALSVANLDWSEIDPSILGTLFERGLDPNKRSQLGAHYTDREKISLIVRSVIIDPWQRRWSKQKEIWQRTLDDATSGLRNALEEAVVHPELSDEVKEISQRRFGNRPQLELFPDAPKQRRTRDVSALQRKVRAADATLSDAMMQANDGLTLFLNELREFRVLDPACGSGNFLNLALLALKDLELLISIEGEAMGLHREFPQIGPSSVKGIEINPYAAELARVSVWIGEIQWMRRNGFGVTDNPILKSLENIECRDAILNDDNTEASWPHASVIIGNPPFLGDREHRAELGNDYTIQLRKAYSGRVPARADLVAYWVLKTVELLLRGNIIAFGLVTTKSIAKGASRRSLDLLTASGPNIFDAWTNEPWVIEGAAVRVSIVCAALDQFRNSLGISFTLNGAAVPNINPDLSSGIDITKASRLEENRRVAFQGVKLTGPFDFGGEEAREILLLPANPNGKGNSDVVSRLFDINDIVGRDSDRWAVDFGVGLSEYEAALYEAPFKIIQEKVVPFRADPEKCRSDEERLKSRYWEFQRPRPDLRRALAGKKRFIVTPESSEHRLFVFVPNNILIQGSLFAITREDDTTFGILSSRIHEIWATAQGNRLGVGNQRRYNVGVTFETFPFPEGLTLDIPSNVYEEDPRATSIAAVAERLNQLRQAWLNPKELVNIIPEVLEGYPERVIPINAEAALVLKKRTLTDLYNEFPAWLALVHSQLDAAVADAYGWPANMSDAEILQALFELNQSRASPTEQQSHFEID